MRWDKGGHSWIPAKVHSFFISSLFLGFLGVSSCRSCPCVVILGQAGKKFEARVEIADTPTKRALGLKYRRELKEDRGMLFLFRKERVQSFWMKDTSLILDLIFINGHQKIVGIIHSANPFSKASLSVSSPSRYVLELRGGIAKRWGIQIGDAVHFEGIK